jgi:hypothetical protein
VCVVRLQPAKNTHTHTHTHMYIVLHVNYSFSCQILMKLEFSTHIFGKYSNMKFYENPFSGSRIFLCGQTDRHNDTYSRFSQICERTRENSFLPHIEQAASVSHEPNLLMFLGETVCLYVVSLTDHINTPCEQTGAFSSVRGSSMCINDCA